MLILIDVMQYGQQNDLNLKQNPNNLLVVPFTDQVESHIAFLLLCYALMIFALSLSTK